MAYTDYEILKSTFLSELKIWPPSEQDFETTLMKAKMNSGMHDIRLSSQQLNYLREIYERTE